MQIPVNARGFENRGLMVDTGNFWSSPVLMIDNMPAPKGAKRGQYLLRRNDGVEATAYWSKTNFLDSVPQIVIDGETFTLAEPLKWYHWVWMGLPVMLVFVGGALGAFIGLMAVALNSRVFRSEQRGILKYVFTGIVSAVAIGIYAVAAIALAQAIRGVNLTPSQVFTSQTGKFSISAPVSLKETTQSVDTQIGPIELHMFSADASNASYMVGYSDYPAEIVNQSDPQKMLDGSGQGMAQNMGGTIVTANQISLNGNPGRELVVTATSQNQKITVKANIYLVGNRLYQVMIGLLSSDFNETTADSFLKSFKLLP